MLSCHVLVIISAPFLSVTLSFWTGFAELWKELVTAQATFTCTHTLKMAEPLTLVQSHSKKIAKAFSKSEVF